jgi:hypothetical protein
MNDAVALEPSHHLYARFGDMQTENASGVICRSRTVFGFFTSFRFDGLETLEILGQSGQFWPIINT